MKRILPFIVFSLSLSCAKKTNPVPPSTPNATPVTPITSRFIPNWQRDTLIAGCVDIQGNIIHDTNTGDAVIDTLITYSINDTSFIQHGNQRYYLWWSPITSLDSFKNNESIYVNCQVSTTKDTTGLINASLSVRPYRYWDVFYNNWATQKQNVNGYGFHKKYKVQFNFYQSIK